MQFDIESQDGNVKEKLKNNKMNTVLTPQDHPKKVGNVLIRVVLLLAALAYSDMFVGIYVSLFPSEIFWTWYYKHWYIILPISIVGIAVFTLSADDKEIEFPNLYGIFRKLKKWLDRLEPADFLFAVILVWVFAIVLSIILTADPPEADKLFLFRKRLCFLIVSRYMKKSGNVAEGFLSTSWRISSKSALIAPNLWLASEAPKISSKRPESRIICSKNDIRSFRLLSLVHVFNFAPRLMIESTSDTLLSFKSFSS